jgi:hypothetical protein
MKTERFTQGPPDKGRRQVDAYYYIERFYNPVRKHSKLDFQYSRLWRGLMSANRPGNREAQCHLLE